MKPILYLDIDGVLWNVKALGEYLPARGAHEFLDFALEHFDVQWLTSWFSHGWVDMVRVEKLARWIKYPVERLQQIGITSAFDRMRKTEVIDFTREFVWVDDENTDKEAADLARHNATHRWFPTDVFEDPDALVKTHRSIESWLLMTEHEALIEPHPPITLEFAEKLAQKIRES